MSAVVETQKYYRVKFDEGYVYRMYANDLTELKSMVASHYWWGEEKPTVALTELTLKRHHRKKSLVHYTATAQGFPVMPTKEVGSSDF
jgi:hypothetical protein